MIIRSIYGNNKTFDLSADVSVFTPSEKAELFDSTVRSLRPVYKNALYEYPRELLIRIERLEKVKQVYADAWMNEWPISRVSKALEE